MASEGGETRQPRVAAYGAELAKSDKQVSQRRLLGDGSDGDGGGDGKRILVWKKTIIIMG